MISIFDWVPSLIDAMRDQHAVRVTDIAIAGSAVATTTLITEVDVICVLTNQSARDRFAFDGLELDVFAGSQHSFRKALAVGQDHVVRMLAEAKVIWDTTGALNELLDSARSKFAQGRRPITKAEDFELQTRPFDLLRKAARATDRESKAYLITLIVDTCLHGFFLRNAEWTVPPHLRVLELTRLSPSLACSLTAILENPAEANMELVAAVIGATCGERQLKRISF
jgi:hypothetical protein